MSTSIGSRGGEGVDGESNEGESGALLSAPLSTVPEFVGASGAFVSSVLDNIRAGGKRFRAGL